MSRFIQAHAHSITANPAQVVAVIQGALDNISLLATHDNGQGIEKGGVALQPGLGHSTMENAGQTVHPFSDVRQSLWPVINGESRSHIGQQGLGGADVGGGLFPANMLLPGLHGHPQGGRAPAVFGDTDNPAGDGALQFVGNGKKGGVRATKAHRYAKTLAVAQDNIGAKLTRRLQQRQGQQVGGYRNHGVLFASFANQAGKVGDIAIGARVLQLYAKDIVITQLCCRVTNNNRDAQPVSAGLDHVDGLWVHIVSHKVGFTSRLAAPGASQ